MNRSFDIVVVGAGPAGLAAATAAACSGRHVALLDENPHVGGQIWRAGIAKSPANSARDRAIADFESSGAEIFAGHQVVDAEGPGKLKAWVDAAHTVETFSFRQLIIATGARERFLPFPGWTLPGVFGAGGLQALVRSGFDVRGKRVVVAGTGPLLLAVAAHLKQDGAHVVCILEQVPMNGLVKLSAGLLSRPRKILQGLTMRVELAGVPYRTGSWPVEAEGREKLTAVRFKDGGNVIARNCDLLACGFHLVPNTELAALLGCAIREGAVQVDSNQQTSLAGVYCAGEPTGVAGVDAALLQGKIAGLAAAGVPQKAARLHARRDAEAAFGHAMDHVFALRPELLRLAAGDTVVCRCEDVRFAALQAAPQSGWTEAKLRTRCGMGACQGRVCGPAIEAIFGWRNNSIRPPLFPIPVAAMSSASLGENEISIPVSQESSR